MPVRIRITLLFSLLVLFILGIVCCSVYYFTYTLRSNSIRVKLTNRAVTVGRLLSQSEVFSNEMIQRIESSTSISFTNKVIQAYDLRNEKIYSYSSVPGDTLNISKEILEQSRKQGSVFFLIREKEAVAQYFTDGDHRLVVVAAGEDPDGHEMLERLKRILLLSFSGGLVIALLGGYIFSKSLLRPLTKIVDDANEISTHNLSRRIHTLKAKDEWQYLSDTLNSLLNRLQEGFEHQKTFIANASHELSTPLTSILSQLEVSLQRQRDAEEYRSVIKSVQQDVLHMIKLTQTLLEFAKASGDPGGLEISQVRIDEVLLRLPAEIAKADRRYNLSFDFDSVPAEEDKLVVYGNEELLFTAVRNIVVNACKYSDDHNAIVTLKTSPGEIVIDIEDHGRGIGEAEFENIFQPFYRVNDNRVKEGFGLGLSLAYRIVKLHKGTITLKSQIEHGTIFSIRFPAMGQLFQAEHRSAVVIER